MDVVFSLSQAMVLGKDILTEAGHKALSEQVIVTAIVLWSLRGHFRGINKRLEDITTALTTIESSHSARIGKLEHRVTIVEQKTTERRSANA